MPKIADRRIATIEAFPRLHLSLIAMTDDVSRVAGGLGFAIQEPSARISCETSSQFEVIDHRDFPLNQDDQYRLLNVLKAYAKTRSSPIRAKVQISGKMPSHMGCGSGTAIRLSALEAFAFILGDQLSREDLRVLSKRGGTSGVGIHTYFDGGFILDAGRKNTDEILEPSSSMEVAAGTPLPVVTCPMPEWEIGICIPKSFERISGEKEREFFKSVCPLPKNNVYEILYESVFGITPAILEHDIQSFSTALSRLQNTEWKQSEHAIYGAQLNELIHDIYDSGAQSIGMSSLGPCLFFVGDDIHMTCCKAQKSRPDCAFIATKTYNQGRRVIDEKTLLSNE